MKRRSKSLRMALIQVIIAVLALPALLPQQPESLGIGFAGLPRPGGKTAVPGFAHIVIVIFENRDYESVIGNPDMPFFNNLANRYSLLTQYYAVAHPSLPNYLALIGGDTFGITTDCTDCFIEAESLPDLIEKKGLTWRTYQEDLPAQGQSRDAKGRYAVRHNPFAYFNAIRKNPSRVAKGIFPFSALSTDLAAGNLADFVFITPNLCNDAHDCKLAVTDRWLASLMSMLLPALDREGGNYLVALIWDEGKGAGSCCGLPKKAGGRVAAVLVSPLARKGFRDNTPYSHYSLLKTVAASWGLGMPGHAADPATSLITSPWN